MDVKELINKISDRLENTRDNLYDITDPRGADGELLKIVKLDNVDDEVYEIIVLLYSKFKSDAQLLRSDNYKILSKTIDSVMDLADALSMIVDAINAAEAAKDKRTLILSKLWGKTFNTSFILFTVLAVFYALFEMVRTDKEAGILVFEFIKSFGISF